MGVQGRPDARDVSFDLGVAVALLEHGDTIVIAARAVGLSTLRRRLREAGKRPRQACLERGVQNPRAPS